jgi:hypothetical protein
MKWVLPDVLGEATLGEVLILILVEPNEDGVVVGVGPPEQIGEDHGNPEFGRGN